MGDLHVKPFVVGQLQTNCYLLQAQNTQQGILIDPGDDVDYITTYLAEQKIDPVLIIATHGHFDHILAVRELQLIYKIPFRVHVKDAFLVERMQQSARYFLGQHRTELPPRVDSWFTGPETITLANHTLEVIETPGHTPGSISIYVPAEKMLFTGDTLFANGAVGRTDFEYASFPQLNHSIKKLLTYPAQTRILAGHGSETSIGTESMFHLDKTEKNV